MEKRIQERDQSRHCIAKGRATALARLLDAGLPPDLPDRYGVTPLMEASRQGQLDCVKTLVAHGANVNAADKEKFSVLMHACTAAAPRNVVRFLISRGARVTDRDVYGCTALMRAASNGDLGTVNVLLQHGSDVNAVSDNQETPLTFAVVWNRPRVVAALTNAGAALDWADDAGWTPLRYAIAERNWKIAEFLQDQGAPVTLPLGPRRRVAPRHSRPS